MENFNISSMKDYKILLVLSGYIMGKRFLI